MKRTRKSYRVSWAPGVNLCQVRLFLSEDCPSKVGQKSQDHLQSKMSSMMHSSTNECNDLPPGFEGNHFFNQSKDDISCIPQIKWKCPSPFVFSPKWLIVAGEESRENQDQKLREMKVLEAIYPRPSAIPPSPSVYLDVEDEDYDDNLTPVVPIIPIEEEESVDIKPELTAAVDTLPTTTAISKPCDTSTLTSLAKPLQGQLPGWEADLAAASVVVAAIMKNNEQGSLIDMDLLVKIFKDPVMIEKLISDHRMATITESSSSTTASVSASGLTPATPPVSLSTATSDYPASGTTPVNTVGLVPASGLKPETPPVSFFMPTPDKLAIPSVPVSRPMFDKQATPPVPPSRPMPAKQATSAVPSARPLPDKPPTPSVPLLTPTADMYRPVNQNTYNLSNGMRPTFSTQPPQQDTILASGVKRAASSTSVGSSEPNTLPLPSASVNLHALATQAQPAVSTVPYPQGKAPNFSVKDANYYKNLIRQHGSDMHEPQIGILPTNLQDLKPVHNFKSGEVKPRIQKPCIYFNSSRGCRNGSNCPYQHDLSVQWGSGNVLGTQSAKRLKLGSEIKGRI